MFGSAVDKDKSQLSIFSKIEDTGSASEDGEALTAILPDEILLKILSYLDFLSLYLKTSLTSKRWQRLSTDKALIKLCFLRTLQESAKSYEQECLERNALARMSTSKRPRGDEATYFFNCLKSDFKMRSKNFRPKLTTLSLVEFIESSWPIECMKIRDDRIYSGGADSIQVWAKDSGKSIMRLLGHTNRVSCLQVDMKYIYSGSWDYTIRIWDKESGEQVKVLEGHKKSVSCLKVADGKVYSGDYDNTILIWDIESGKILHTLKGHIDHIKRIELTDEIFFSFSSSSTIYVWERETGELLKTIVDFTTGISCMRELKGKIYIGCCDGKIRILDSKSERLLKELKGHDSNVIYLEVFDGKIISASRDKTIRIWDADSGVELKRLDGHRPDSKFFVSIHVLIGKIYAEYNDGTLWVWEF